MAIGRSVKLLSEMTISGPFQNNRTRPSLTITFLKAQTQTTHKYDTLQNPI